MGKGKIGTAHLFGLAVSDIMADMGTRPSETYTRRHTFDWSFFDHIDTEAKAYILGFLAADGHVDGDKVAFSAKAADRDVLDQIRVAMGASQSIRFRDTEWGGKVYKQATLELCSRPMVRRLADMGLAELKIKRTSGPVDVPDHLLAHWLRGYWDGDGWLTKRRCASGFSPIVSCAGWSRPTMEDIANLSARFCGTATLLERNGTGWAVRLQADRARRWLRVVYPESAVIGLARKRMLAKELVALPPLSLSQAQCLRRQREQREAFARYEPIRQARREGQTYSQIARTFGIDPSWAWELCRRKST